MKRNLLRADYYISILVILIQLFFLTSCTNIGITEEQKMLEEMLIRMERQGPATNANDDIMNVLVENYGTGEERYPEDFAGIFYRESDAKLIVLLTDMKGMQKYLDCTEYADAIVFQQAEYSYNFLNDHAEEAAQAYAKKYAVNFYGVNQKTNRVDIGVDPEDYEAAKIEDPKGLGIQIPVHIYEIGPYVPYDAE